jgi:hypothetical protein
MQTVLIVNTPADSSNLTDLATIKAELGITDTSEDTNLTTWIAQASASCAAYCDRVFGLEVVTETFRNRFSFVYRTENRVDSIRLARNPVVTITSIVCDTVVLVQDVDYELDPVEGILYRLDGFDNIIQWCFAKLVINYSGGWALIGTLPLNIERACIVQVKSIRSDATRDTSVKSESIPGVLSTTYVTSNNTDSVSLDPIAAGFLDPYRNIGV